MKVLEHGKSLWSEFQAFAFKGNMIDLAVAVVIGAAFSKVIDALVKDIVMPIVNVVTPKFPYQNWHVWYFPIGHLIGELLNFIIVSFVVFLTVVKLTQTVMKKARRDAVAPAPVTKQCPYCLSVIPVMARKCAHCTSDLTEMPPPAVAAQT
jgi:large conductance mechanosensitive channel